MNTLDDEYELEFSSRCGPLERDGRSVQVHIYRGRREEEGHWILEIVDDDTDCSILWDDQFETDVAAYDHLMKEIDEQGLASILDDSPRVEFPE